MSDSFAVIGANIKSIPYFQSSPVKGIAKCNLSSAINKYVIICYNIIIYNIRL